jgi:capsular exopolysaccharide synthesis family protein
MEKIKDALVKAKVDSGVILQRGVLKNGKKALKFKHVDEELKSIVYTKSAIVHLNNDHLETNRIVAQNKHDPASWVFDSIRTQVLQIMEENKWRTLAVVSPTPASGKTLVAINLAISIAQQPHKTAILVDFDLRKPRVAEYLGLKQEKSMNDFLEGNIEELSEIIVNPGIPRLTIIPTNKTVNKSAENLSSGAVQELVIDLKDRYDSRVVIFDLPPLLNVDDAMVVLPLVDCVLLVVADGEHTESELNDTMRLLSKSNIVAVVANKAEVEVRSYY